jgi:hypothetical protein
MTEDQLKQACDQGYEEGRRLERARIFGIINSPEAEGRRSLAIKVALAGVSVEQGRAVLETCPKEPDPKVAARGLRTCEAERGLLLMDVVSAEHPARVDQFGAVGRTYTGGATSGGGGCSPPPQSPGRGADDHRAEDQSRDHGPARMAARVRGQAVHVGDGAPNERSAV